MTLKELREKLKAALMAAQAIATTADEAKRDFTAEERQKLQGHLEEARKWKEQIRVAEGDEAMRKAIADMGFGAPDGNGGKAPDGGTAGKGKTLGEQFVGSEVYQNWMRAVGGKSGMIPEGMGIQSPAVEFKSLLRKDLITGASDISAGAFVQTDYTGIYEPIGRWPLTLRDLVDIRQTLSDTVEFVRQTKQVTEAAPTPEANVKYPTGATGEITGTKPQGSLTFEKVYETVKTIAVYVGATRRALSDAAQIRGIIDQELREDLADELEDQLCNGNGIGENFTGIANQAGTLIQAFDTDIHTTARRAIENLLVVGRQMPTAWVFHPTDWATVELLRDNDGRFYHNGPLNQGPAQLWSVPVVQSFHVTQGSAWLANWRKAVLWDREQASISVTDSHDDWFIRNLIAILAEMRAAFGLIRPSAFVNVELS